jgi:uncharacterized membrane protein
MTTAPQDQDGAPASLPTPRRAGNRRLLIGGLSLIGVLFLLAPGSLLDKADHIGYAVCHQIPVRSYFFGNHQLPLCARCSGQYLGALGGLLVLVALGRGRSGRLPPTPIALVLLGFFLLWAFDGFNSYLTLIPGAPHLYEPQNILRVTTGALQGVALIALVLPFFNTSFWATTSPIPTVARWRELGLLLLLVAAIVAAASSSIDALLYPLALLSVGGTLMMLTIVNTMLITILLRREAQARSWRDALPLLVAGLALGTLEVLVINLLRAWLTAQLGLPF